MIVTAPLESMGFVAFEFSRVNSANTLIGGIPFVLIYRCFPIRDELKMAEKVGKTSFEFVTFVFNLPDLEVAESRLGVDVLTVGVVADVIHRH